MPTSDAASRESIERRRKSILIPENLTVEEFLTQQCEQLVDKAYRHAEIQVAALKQHYQEKKKEILAAFEDNQENDAGNGNMAEKLLVHVVLKVTSSGTYSGKIFELNLRHGKPCMVGRSSGRNFTSNGISLSKDPEISTTHGKIELLDDCAVVFTDCGSTNGTMVNETSLEENVPTEIQQGDQILVGATTLVVESLT